jgi:hypothetical protein
VLPEMNRIGPARISTQSTSGRCPGAPNSDPAQASMGFRIRVGP